MTLASNWLERILGDGVTRYRFFERDKVPANQSYFGPANGIHTALGLKKAWDFAYAYTAGASC